MPMQVGVGVAAVVFRGKDILLMQRAGKHGAGKWAAPGGWLEPHETLEDCAKRELEEETGLVLGTRTYPKFEGGRHIYTLDWHEEGVNDVCFWVLMNGNPDLPMPQIMESEKCSAARYFTPQEYDVLYDEGLLFAPFYNLPQGRLEDMRLVSTQYQIEDGYSRTAVLL